MMIRVKKLMTIILMAIVLFMSYFISLPVSVQAQENTTQNTVINKSDGNIKLTIEHFENGEEFYKADHVELKPGDSIIGFNKAKNYSVENVTLDGKKTEDVQKVIIKTSGDHTLKVFYQPTEDPSFLKDVHFYDYSMFPDDGTPGINDLSNYEPGAKLDDIVGKRDKTKVYGNMFTIGLTTSQGAPLKVASRYSGFYDENGNPVYINQGQGDKITKGIVKSLSGENYSQVNFRDGIYAPKLFNNDPNVHVNGLTNIDNYKLRFERNGDTYTLKEVLKPDGTHAGNHDENGNPTDKYEGSHNFFPLDDYNTDSKINGSKTYGKQLADGSIEWHNMLFGMRFDVMFNTDQYSDLSKMNFHFSGDDDLWVFIDGKLALDVGGNHGEIPGSVDIGNYIDKDEVGKDHQLTVLYLERGGNYSNCAISFTLPTTNAMEFKEADTTNAIINKVDKKTQKALSNAEFTLSDSKNNKQTYTTDDNGQIALTGLTEGTYTLKETKAPEGYVLSDSNTYKLVVNYDEQGKLGAKLYQADGKLLDGMKIENTSKKDYKAEKSIINTGDSTDTSLFLLLAASAALGLILVSTWRRKSGRS